MQALVSAREQLGRQEAAADGGGNSSSKKKSASALSKRGGAKASPDAVWVRRQERAIRASIEGLYKLFEGLQAIMAGQSYMEVRWRCVRTHACVCLWTSCCGLPWVLSCAAATRSDVLTDLCPQMGLAASPSSRVTCWFWTLAVLLFLSFPPPTLRAQRSWQ